MAKGNWRDCRSAVAYCQGSASTQNFGYRRVARRSEVTVTNSDQEVPGFPPEPQEMRDGWATSWSTRRRMSLDPLTEVFTPRAAGGALRESPWPRQRSSV